VSEVPEHGEASGEERWGATGISRGAASGSGGGEAAASGRIGSTRIARTSPGSIPRAGELGDRATGSG